RSEVDLSGNLYTARSAIAADHAERRAGVVGAGEPVGVDQVESVERLAAQLEFPATLGAVQVEVLTERDVHVGEAWAAHGTASGVAGTEGAVGNRREARRIEPRSAGSGRRARECFRRALVGIADHVRTRAGRTAVANVAEPGRIEGGGGHRERLA